MAEAEEKKVPRTVEKWLNKTLRVELTDGRVIEGTFVCTDREPNMILINSREYWKSQERKDAPLETPTRNVGMVVIARRHISRIFHVISPTPLCSGDIILPSTGQFDPTLGTNASSGEWDSSGFPPSEDWSSKSG